MFPDSLKHVVKNYKNALKNYVNFYRLISLLSSFLKIIESLVCDYFLSNDLLHYKQFGFLKNSTIELSVNQIVKELIEADVSDHEILKGGIPQGSCFLIVVFCVYK